MAMIINVALWSLSATRHSGAPASARPSASSTIPQTPAFTFNKCYLCSRSTLLPMFPVAQSQRSVRLESLLPQAVIVRLHLTADSRV